MKDPVTQCSVGLRSISNTLLINSTFFVVVNLEATTREVCWGTQETNEVHPWGKLYIGSQKANCRHVFAWMLVNFDGELHSFRSRGSQVPCDTGLRIMLSGSLAHLCSLYPGPLILENRTPSGQNPVEPWIFCPTVLGAGLASSKAPEQQPIRNARRP